MIKEKIRIENILKFLPERKDISHKNTFGKVLIVGGSSSMSGAVSFTANSCMRAGCGLVYVLTPSSVKEIISVTVPEAIVFSGISKNFLDLKDIKVFREIIYKADPDLLVFGPGMGNNSATSSFLMKAIEVCGKPAVFDADALNIISSSRNYKILKERPAIMTPHYGEATRFFDIKDREELAIKISKECESVVVLKDSTTYITDGNKLYFLDKPNSALSKAGSGDVLCGIIAGLWVQSGKKEGFNISNAVRAAVCGVFLHSVCGQICRDRLTQYSVIARDLISSIPLAFKRILK